MRLLNSKRRAGLLGLALISGFALTAIVHAAVSFGPDRTTFTWAKPATYITFNSITDNPDSSIGDERTFISARDVASSDKLTYTKNMPVKDNQEVLVRVFFHNDAAQNLNLVATNTKLRVLLPTGESTNPQAAAYVSADNSNPKMVWATMDFTNSQPFSMEYETGSAQLWTQYVTGTKVSDDIVASGALIGTQGTDGKVPGCSQFSGYVTMKVRIHLKQTPPPQAKFACDMLDVKEVDKANGKFDFTAHGSATNANITSYKFVATDASNNQVDTNTVNTSATSAVYHFSQSKPGTYTVSTVVNTDKGNTKGSECVKQVTVPEKPTTPTPPVTPPQVQGKSTELPNTGAGDVLGLFAGASGIGAAGHYMVRRFRRGQ